MKITKLKLINGGSQEIVRVTFLSFNLFRGTKEIERDVHRIRENGTLFAYMDNGDLFHKESIIEAFLKTGLETYNVNIDEEI